MIILYLRGLLAVFAFTVLVTLVGFLISGVSGFFGGLLLALGCAIVVLMFSTRIALWALRARIIDRHEASSTYGLLESLCQRFRCSVPALAITDSPQPAIASVGLSPKKRVIVVAVSCFKLYNASEIEALLAIELASLRSSGSFWRSVVAILGSLPGLLMNFGVFSRSIGGNPHEFQSSIFSRWVSKALSVVSSALAWIGIHRPYQFRLDLRALRMTGNLDSMVLALRKLSMASGKIAAPMLSHAPGLANIYVHEAAPSVSFASLSVSTERRVAQLLDAVQQGRVPIDKRFARTLNEGRGRR